MFYDGKEGSTEKQRRTDGELRTGKRKFWDQQYLRGMTLNDDGESRDLCKECEAVDRVPDIIEAVLTIIYFFRKRTTEV